MSDEAISIDRTMSILGYALLPLVLLSFLALIITLRSMTGTVIAITSIVWCVINATRMFEQAISLKEQRWLVAYPTTILYACFALLTVF